MKSSSMCLSILAFSLLLTGCNEKINSKVGSPGGTIDDAAAPDLYYFRVKNTSPAMLNYRLHRTGAGRAVTNCEITDSAKFTSESYRADASQDHDSKKLDITCFFEAEELALYFNGLSFAVEASQNTCDYIGYSPYSYYNRMPGDSSATYHAVVCEGTGNGALANRQDSNGTLGCGEMADYKVNLADRVARPSPADYSELCTFNYTDQKCDVGVITVIEHLVSVDDVGVESSAQQPSKKISCGGKVANCIRGPIKKERPTRTMNTLIFASEMDVAPMKSFEYPKLIGTGRAGNFEYVNFRRNLASPHIQFGDQMNDYPNYVEAFRNDTYGRSFDPQLMERYAYNMDMSGAPIVGQAEIAQKTIENGYSAKPLAAEPYMGLPTSSLNSFPGFDTRTSPFYTFYCFDRAEEVRARIRMVVRDWDRIYPANTGMGGPLELISDLYMGASARQDIPIGEEIPGDTNPHNQFNDYYDWDDLILMTRSPGAFSESSTTWEPYEVPLLYPRGFFNPALFPKENPEEDKD